MDIVKVTSVLELFFAFNPSKDKASLELEESNYTDSYFRWTKDTFRHKQKLTAIYSDRRIDVFNTERVRDRLHSNTGKIKHDEGKNNFGCNFSIVSDLVVCVYAEEITDSECIEFKNSEDEMKLEHEEREKEIKKKK